MAGFHLELPTIQNWNCHSCSGCCKRHQIEITEEERQRMVDQGWMNDDSLPDHEPAVVWFKGPRWKKNWRLGSQADGACVFLDEEGLCRIHAKFGEPTKPLACRVYPYAFHPAGKKVTVSVRFSCPSVVENRGKAIVDQSAELKQMAREVVPDGTDRIPPPEISPRSTVDWPDFLRFVSAIETTLADESTPVLLKLKRTLFWLNLVEQSRFDTVSGQRLDEFLRVITEAAEQSVVSEDASSPSKTGCTLFRMLVAQYARNDTSVDIKSGWRNRWRLLTTAVRFARGRGDVPPLQNVFRPIPFSTIEKPFGPPSEEAEEMLTRYFRVKTKGLQFCGRAFFDIGLVEGFRSLVLVYPSILWLARWLAAGDERTRIETNDVAQAIAIADHYHAYTPAFGTRAFRRRVRIITRLGDIEKLCDWYSQ
jgi:lysine-N-methylase